MTNLNIPVGQGSFKRDFLGGAGTISVAAAGGGFDLAKPFPEGLKQVLNASATPDGKLHFGSPTGLSFDATFGGQTGSSIRVIWPGQASDAAAGYASRLQPGQVGLLLAMSGKASGAIEGSFPAGPAALTFGIGAGAGIGYDRFAVYPGANAAADCLLDLLAGVRLPQGCDAVDRIPLPGEILAFRYDGFLELTAALNWGYQITGLQGFQFNDLDAVVSYAARLKAGASAAWRMGGSFAIEASAGSRDGWIRLRVRKDRESQFDFAAAFVADGEIRLDGLPETADEFLLAFFGSDARGALHVFDRVRTLSDPKELEKYTGKLLLDSVTSLANKWLAAALDDSTAGRFLAMAQQAVREYDDARQKFGDIVDPGIDLYEDYMRANQLPALQQALETIVRLNSRDALRSLPPDAPAWEIIQRLAGGSLFLLLQDNAVFARVVDTAEFTLDLLNGNHLPKVRDIVDQTVKDFPLDRLFGQLKLIATNEGLRNLASARLQGIVEKLLGKVWEEIHPHTDRYAAELRRTLDNIEDFKNRWYAKLKQAVNQSFALTVNATYSRTSRDEALVDVEIDLSTPEGRDLFRKAASGRFGAVLSRASLRSVVVNEGVLTHQVGRSTQISVAVFGWSFKRLVELVSKTDFSIDSSPTGLVELFTTDVSIKQRQERTGRDKLREIAESNFLLRLTGEVFRPDEEQNSGTLERKRALARVLSRMGASYTFFESDDLTTPAEMTDYLKLGEMVGLVPAAAAMSAELQRQFPNGFGKVTAHYVVTYDDEGIRDAFTHASGEPLREMVRSTSRQLVGAALTASRDRARAMLGFAYLNAANAKLYYESGFTTLRDDASPVTLPGWWTRSGDQVEAMPAGSALRHALVTLYSKESGLADALVELDRLVDRARDTRCSVRIDKLEDAARRFLSCAASVDGFIDMNTFFGVFDRFVHSGGNGRRRRESSLILEIQPPGADTPVRKYLSAPPADRLVSEQVMRAAAG